MACSGMDCSAHCSPRKVALDAVASDHEGMQQVKGCGSLLQHLTFYPISFNFITGPVTNRMALRPYEVRCCLDASAHDLVEGQTGYLFNTAKTIQGGTTLPRRECIQSILFSKP